MNPQSSFAACRTRERNGAHVWEGSAEKATNFGRIDFNHGELPNRGIVATEIFETTCETKCAGHGRRQCHRPQIVLQSAQQILAAN
jgi:hypothetical protein